MQIGVIGINHKSGSLELRERVTRAILSHFKENRLYFFPLVCLVTCNRSEIYFSGENVAAIHTDLMSLLRLHIPIEFEHALYAYFGVECFLHLLKVCSGLDSALWGETEIQGQVKNSYTKAAEHGYLNSELHYLFQRCLSLSRKVRQHFATIPSNRLAKTLWNLCENHLSPNASLLFVGASSLNAKIIDYFKTKNAVLTLTNRTDTHGEKMAAKQKLEWLSWDKTMKKGLWCSFNAVFFATSAKEFLVRQNDLKSTHMPRLLFDLALPRNIDPQIAHFLYFQLYNLDEIQLMASLGPQQLTKMDNEQLLQLTAFEIHRFKKRAERGAIAASIVG